MKRILFVDDESKILEGIRRMLHTDRNRWEIQYALSGEAGLNACAEGSFDIVIADMRMPGMDGPTFLGHIRDRFPDTARIVLSGYSEAALTSRAVPMVHRFLTKPCDRAELQSTIERVCALRDLMSGPKTRSIVGAVGELPSLSRTYVSLTRAAEDPNTSISQIGELIGQDVAMSAKVLQLVNSAFFGVPQKVTSVLNAVAYLGIETIKNLALYSEAFRVLIPDSRIPLAVHEALQGHARRVAAIVGVLPIDRKNRDLAVVAALLHDVGTLILMSKMPDKFCTAQSIARQRGCKPFEAELELLGASHAEIGAYLLGLWGIPELAVEAVAHHHHPLRITHTGFDTTVAVYVADLLAHELDAHPSGASGFEIDESDRDCLEKLGVLFQFADFRELAVQSLD